MEFLYFFIVGFFFVWNAFFRSDFFLLGTLFFIVVKNKF